MGAVAAFLFYMTVSPNAPHALGVSLGEGSIVILAIVVASLFSNAFWASGFCLVFLVVSDPETIAHTTATIVSEHALGVLAGSALAALAFHLVPSRGLVHGWRKQRLKQVAETIGTLIASPVAQQTTSTDHAWQSRSIDSLVRLALPDASRLPLAIPNQARSPLLSGSDFRDYLFKMKRSFNPGSLSLHAGSH